MSDQNVSASSGDESNNEVDISDSDRVRIREELSSLSFEHLKQLKNEIGSKAYNESIFGVNQSSSSKSRDSFKRANKNRPREMSSKRRVKSKAFTATVKDAARDPRFDPLCGSFDRTTFKSNYSFVDELRQKEKGQLEKELLKTKNLDRKNDLKYVIQRLDNQIREKQKIDVVEQQKSRDKEEIKDKLKRGEKVIYKKKSTTRVENLIKKYEELKKSNKLQKHMERKSKKLSQKEKKKLNVNF